MRLEDSLTAMVADLVSNISNPPLLNPPLSYCLHHEVESRLKDSLTVVLADLATKFKAITSDSQLSTFRDSASEALHGESVLLTIPDSKISRQIWLNNMTPFGSGTSLSQRTALPVLASS